jgi:alanyl-tRNA synthetase
MSPSGERRFPFAVHPVLFLGSHRVVQVRTDVAIEAVAPPVVWTLSTRVVHRPQAVDLICIDQPRRFSMLASDRDNGDMPMPRSDSLVTYPGGALSGRSVVLLTVTRDDQILVLTESTPCHPVDPRWPDQGPDLGTLAAGEVSAPLIDCVIGASDGSALFVGDEVPVRRGEPGWAFVVVHVLAAGGLIPVEGDEVLLTVDAAHRAALSAGHTGCHLAAVALNAALAARWRKPVRTDGLGHPDFDQLAIVSSKIVPDGAVDTYRLGRSLRKKGFDVDGLAVSLPEITADANHRLAGWVASGACVDLTVGGPRLTDLREWVCVLPEGTQRIPCGGTHLRSLAEVAAVDVELVLDEAIGELVMTTRVRR